MSDLETKKYLFDKLTKWSNLHWLTEKVGVSECGFDIFPPTCVKTFEASNVIYNEKIWPTESFTSQSGFVVRDLIV